MLEHGKADVGMQIKTKESLAEMPGEVQSDGNISMEKLIDCREQVFCCEVCPESNHVAVGLNNGVVKILDVFDGKHFYTLVDVEVRRTYLPAVTCSWLGKERLVVGYASGSLKIWNISNQECLATVDERRTILATCIPPTQDMVITSGNNSDIYLYSLPGLRLIRQLSASPSKTMMDGHRSSVYALKHHPVDNWNFLSGGWDNTVQFWDRRDNRAQRRIFGTHICGNAIDINPKDNTILTGSWRSHHEGLQIWDYREGELIRDIPDEQNERCNYYAAQFIGEDCIIAGGSKKDICKVKEKRGGVEMGHVYNLNKAVYCIDTSRHRVRGETVDVRACFGFANFLALVDVSDVDQSAAIKSSILDNA